MAELLGGKVNIEEGERVDETGFGQLRLIQKPEEFCYGVDAVLLADFAANGAKRKKNCRIMDLGTGTGIVPLILSHKTDAVYIGALELQDNSSGRKIYYR